MGLKLRHLPTVKYALDFEDVGKEKSVKSLINNLILITHLIFWMYELS